MKFCSIVGARPNFIKLAPISRAIRKKHKEIIIHTNQHYDENMSDIFFKTMHLPKPNYILDTQKSSPCKQLGDMIANIEPILIKERPHVVIVFGDTNSTLAGAIVANKLNIPIAHIESGCRSYDMTMPEEGNRIMIDHISNFLFAPTSSAAKILQLENVIGQIYDYGDVIVDVLQSVQIKPIDREYILTTIHRPVNADSYHTMDKILSALNSLKEEIIFPVHPRTINTLDKYGLKEKYSHINYISPMDYTTMISYIKHAKMIVTDSGGIQKEAFILRTPCLTLRNTTEWTETTEMGWNVLVPYITKQNILHAIKNYKTPLLYVDCFGSPGASERIIKCIEKNLIANV